MRCIEQNEEVLYCEGNFQFDPNHPLCVFFGGSGKTAKAPAASAPAATVRSIDEDVKQRDRDKRRQRIVASGRQGTILTEGQPLGQSATLLGRSSS